MSEPGIATADIVTLFEKLFFESHRTVLRSGGDEPWYLPHDAHGIARIVSRRDYLASALHEVAHWCIAGAARRRRVDYGYWYRPDGRGADVQQRFEAVESMPQAIEWLFAEAVGQPFRVSLDNLAADSGARERLLDAVVTARRRFERQGLPPRAARFRTALAAAQDCRVR